MTPIDTFIAVHGGAGFHHPEHDKRIKKALRLQNYGRLTSQKRSACTRAIECLSSETDDVSIAAVSKDEGTGNGALAMVENAIISLEDDPYLNAGYGSNLTIDGTVECDASVFTGRGYFGGVGAVSGIKNPISVARSVLEYSRGEDKLGRVPPMMLVSGGAVSFARAHALGNISVPPESMITPMAKETWIKWKARLENTGPVNDGSVKADITMSDAELDAFQDTVGAVAWHSLHGLAAGVSSGGLLLKHPGRVGEAAVFGAGCWAQDYAISGDRSQDDRSFHGMACSISGTGEQIIRANLARAIGEAYKDSPDGDPHEILRRSLVEKFWSKEVFH